LFHISHAKPQKAAEKALRVLEMWRFRPKNASKCSSVQPYFPYFGAEKGAGKFPGPFQKGLLT
jgi:hypothetical protein